MNGNGQINSTPAFAADTNLGSIDLNLNSGDATIPAANVASTVVSTAAAAATGTLFDPTGTWNISAVDFSLPHGVRSTCTSAEQQNNTCNGPPEGMKLYLQRLQGTDADGTVYGMQVWQDQGGNPKGQMTACGSGGVPATGLGSTDKTNAGLLTVGGTTDTGTALADAAFTFASTVVDSHAANATATLGNTPSTIFQASTAKAQWDMQACTTVSVAGTGSYVGSTYNGYKCGPDTTYGDARDSYTGASTGGRYQVNLSSGGCVVTSTGASIPNMDWNLVDWQHSTCTTQTDTPATNYITNTCTTHYDISHANTAITCSNASGVFTSTTLATAAPTPSGCNGNCQPMFNWDKVANYANQGQLCNTMAANKTPTPDNSPGAALAQANCYANYYEQYISRNATGCLPKINVDWSATTAANFVKVDFRPSALVFMDKLTYSDANTASMLTEQNQNQGVQITTSGGSSQWVSCPAIDKGGLSFTKISATKILATYTSNMVTTSSEPACQGASWNGVKQKFQFYLTKQ